MNRDKNFVANNNCRNFAAYIYETDGTLKAIIVDMRNLILTMVYYNDDVKKPSYTKGSLEVNDHLTYHLVLASTNSINDFFDNVKEFIKQSITEEAANQTIYDKDGFMVLHNSMLWQMDGTISITSKVNAKYKGRVDAIVEYVNKKSYRVKRRKELVKLPVADRPIGLYSHRDDHTEEDAKNRRAAFIRLVGDKYLRYVFGRDESYIALMTMESLDEMFKESGADEFLSDTDKNIMASHVHSIVYYDTEDRDFDEDWEF